MRLLEESSRRVLVIMDGVETEASAIGEAAAQALRTAERTEDGIALLRTELGRFKIDAADSAEFEESVESADSASLIEEV
jgi:hypothetical protein